MTQASSELQEIKDLIRSIATEPAPVPDKIHAWINRARQSCDAKVDHARICLFFGRHGFAAKLKLPDDGLDDYIRGNIEGTGILNRICQTANCDLRLYEMDAETPTADSLDENAAMDTESLVRAIAYGMMAVEPGIDMIASSAFGHGSTASVSALVAAHGSNSSDDLTAARLLKINNGRKGFDALQAIGGFELAALCGLIIAARLAHAPVLLEGVAGLAALTILQHENAGIVGHCAMTGTGGDIVPENIPLFPLPHPVPDQPGLAMACFLPVLRNRVILQA